MAKLLPEMAPEAEGLFEQIQKTSQEIATRKGLPHVTREISLYATMLKYPDVLETLDTYGIQQDYMFRELEIKYNEIDYNFRHNVTADPEEASVDALIHSLKKNADQPPMPDIHYLTDLGAKLSDPSHKLKMAVWLAFREGFESTNPKINEPFDNYPYQEQCSNIMAKYLYDAKHDLFVTEFVDREVLKQVKRQKKQNPTVVKKPKIRATKRKPE